MDLAFYFIFFIYSIIYICIIFVVIYLYSIVCLFFRTVQYWVLRFLKIWNGNKNLNQKHPYQISCHYPLIYGCIFKSRDAPIAKIYFLIITFLNLVFVVILRCYVVYLQVIVTHFVSAFQMGNEIWCVKILPWCNSSGNISGICLTTFALRQWKPLIFC